MILGARTAAWAKSGGRVPTAKDYVQDGLVAMWDGIEGGWANIVGGHEQMEFVGTHQLKNDCVYIDGLSGAYGIVNGLSLGSNPTTQEFVVKIDDQDIFGRLIAEQTGLCLGRRSNNYSLSFWLYGFGVDTQISLVDTILGKRLSVSVGIGSEKVDHVYINGKSDIYGTFYVAKSNYPSVVTFFNREAGERGITGELCCARIYNRVISAQDIAHNYEIDKSRFNLP